MLAEGIEVKGAWLDNGLLHIDLARPQPEVRVKTIQISNPNQSQAQGTMPGPMMTSRVVVDGEG